MLLLAACSVAWSCASEEIPRYGTPEDVAGGVGGSGTGGSGAGAGTTTTTAECDPDPSCSVSFADTIFPILNETSKCASDLCHGGGAGDLTMEATVESYYSTLTTISIDTGKYVVGCDEQGSQLLCNLQLSDGENPNGECGTLMPLLAKDGPTMAQFNDIKDWIACGAPNN